MADFEKFIKENKITQKYCIKIFFKVKIWKIVFLRNKLYYITLFIVSDFEKNSKIYVFLCKIFYLILSIIIL